MLTKKSTAMIGPAIFIAVTNIEAKIMLAFALSYGGSKIMDVWRIIFSHAHSMEVTVDEIRSLLIIVITDLIFLFFPVFLVIFCGSVGGFLVRPKSMEDLKSSSSNLLKPIFNITIIFLISVVMVQFKLDQILSVMSLTVEQIFNFVWKLSLEIVAIILIVKIILIALLIFYRRFRTESKPLSHR